MSNIKNENKYFRVNEINADTVLLTTNLPTIKDSYVSFLLDTLTLVTTKAKKNMIVDVSQIEYIDPISCMMLTQKVMELLSEGKSIKLVVSKEKPIISYCVGDPIAKLDVYLSQREALKDLLN